MRMLRSKLIEIKEREHLDKISDIKGAHNAGLRSVWFNPAHKAMTGDAAPDYEIDALEKLPILLAELSEVSE